VNDELAAELARLTDQRHLFSRLAARGWVPLAAAAAEAGVSRSALRSWYRQGDLPSRLVEGPNGPQRIVPHDAVVERATRSPRIRRPAERQVGLEAEVALLRSRLDQLERRLASLEGP
jgi:hypothetical protein